VRPSAWTWRAIPKSAPAVTVKSAIVARESLNKNWADAKMLDGGWREFCLIAADQFDPHSRGVTYEEAASLPVAYGTAHRMLVTHNTVKKGDRVLILGASEASAQAASFFRSCWAPR